MREAHGATKEYHEPGRYEIRLKGHLDQRLAGRFEGLTLSHDGEGTTILFGLVVDQAALYGLLRKVRDLGLPLLSVVHIGLDQADVQPGTVAQTSETEATP